MGTTLPTSDRVCQTQDELVADCRIAQAKRIPYVFATRRVMSFFLGESPEISFTMMGVEVVEEGKLEKVLASRRLTIEQVNFGG